MSPKKATPAEQKKASRKRGRDNDDEIDALDKAGRLTETTLEWKTQTINAPEFDAITQNCPFDNTKPIVPVQAGSRMGWNRNLIGQLQPNTIYQVTTQTPPGGGFPAAVYEYETDAQGRVIKARGILTLGSADRYPSRQGDSVWRGDGAMHPNRDARDEGGHIFGAQFMGPGEDINYVPQNGIVNGEGAWYQMEMDSAAELKAGNQVAMEVEVIYHPDPKNKRPAGFNVLRTIRQPNGTVTQQAAYIPNKAYLEMPDDPNTL